MPTWYLDLSYNGRVAVGVVVMLVCLLWTGGGIVLLVESLGGRNDGR